MAKFIELLRSGEQLECDLIIGDSDMPASFYWDDECLMTKYGEEVFKDIINSEYTRLPNGNIEIHCDDYRLGEKFVYAAAGFISKDEFDKMFQDKNFYSEPIVRLIISKQDKTV